MKGGTVIINKRLIYALSFFMHGLRNIKAGISQIVSLTKNLLYMCGITVTYFQNVITRAEF